MVFRKIRTDQHEKNLISSKEFESNKRYPVSLYDFAIEDKLQISNAFVFATYI